MQPESSQPDISHGVFAQEIAERQWAERALYESEERLRLFVENVPAAIAMFDREMRYMAVSRRWRMQYLGGRECLGHCHYDVFPIAPSAGETRTEKESLAKLSTSMKTCGSGPMASNCGLDTKCDPGILRMAALAASSSSSKTSPNQSERK